jgi:hypothetical protein
LGTVVVGIAIGLVTGFAVMETYASFDAVALWLMNQAASHIVKDQRERYREEWAADLSAIPTSLYKLAYAVINFRKSVAHEINAVFVAGALDLFDEIATEFGNDFSRTDAKMKRIRARLKRGNWPDELRNDFAALERGHHTLGIYVDKTLELKCRLEARATQIDSVASADAWFEEAEFSLDEIIALLESVKLPARTQKPRTARPESRS